ncbi:MAG: tetratricopeptide repeat protein [Acidobacteriota bacterium]
MGVPVTAMILALALSLLQDSPVSDRQEPGQAVSSELPSLDRLPLNEEKRGQLKEALRMRDLGAAEKVLVGEIESQPTARELLVFAGNLFFLDRKYLNSAIAFKKAEALQPLDPSSRFTLAMSYIVLERRDWARPELEKLREEAPSNPLYWYWLARLDYDAQQFSEAIRKFQSVIELDPQFMKAFDNLGLCYEGLGQFDEAIQSYQKAIELNRRLAAPSPWPALNLGTLLARLNRLDEAETSLQESVHQNGQLSQTHYQLGIVFEKKNQLVRAIEALDQSVRIDPAYPEPHYALGRIYRRRGESEKAKEAFAAFEKLKTRKRGKGADSGEPSHTPPSHAAESPEKSVR